MLQLPDKTSNAARVRIYIGQTTSLNSRVKQHWNFRYRRDNPSLHYHAVQNSSFDIFAVLATLPSPRTPGYHDLPGMDRPDLLLNILEMWTCLLFRCLPQQILVEYLPVTRALGEGHLNVALNISNPLEQGEKGSREWVDLSGSGDPLVQDYLKSLETKTGPVTVPDTPLLEKSVVEEQTKTPELLPTSITISPTTLLVVGATILVGFLLLRERPRR